MQVPECVMLLGKTGTNEDLNLDTKCKVQILALCFSNLKALKCAGNTVYEMIFHISRLEVNHTSVSRQQINYVLARYGK